MSRRIHNVARRLIEKGKMGYGFILWWRYGCYHEMRMYHLLGYPMPHKSLSMQIGD